VNALTLKIIAIVTMTIDHAGAVLLSHYIGTEYVGIYLLTRWIGRIAFPIFAYLIAQGCVHTRSMPKYMMRLGILAIVSEFFFDMALTGNGTVNFLAQTNIFYTLFLAVVAIWLYQLSNKKWWGWLLVLPSMAVASLLTTDYGAFGVLFIFVIYAIGKNTKLWSAVVLAAGMMILYFPMLEATLFAMVSVLCVLAYNGKSGPKNPVLQYGFYAFYPAHLGALMLIT